MSSEAPVQSLPPWVVRAFLGPYGVRSGWRIALWTGTFVFLAASMMLALKLAGIPASLETVTAVELSAAVVAGWGMLAVIDRRPFGALGYAADPVAPRDTSLGFALGGVAIAVAVGVLTVAGTVRWVADSGTWPEYVAALARALILFTVAAAAEEAMFRGYAFQALVQGIGAWPTVLVTSALFAAAHLGNPNLDVVGLANIFLAGVMLGWAYLRTRSLWFATGVHMGWNWTMSALLDFPVSGLVRDTPLYDVAAVGPAWMTGGSFGPEASVVGTVVILLLLALFLRAPWIRESARMAGLRPLVDDRLGVER